MSVKAGDKYPKVVGVTAVEKTYKLNTKTPVFRRKRWRPSFRVKKKNVDFFPVSPVFLSLGPLNRSAPLTDRLIDGV